MKWIRLYCFPDVFSTAMVRDGTLDTFLAAFERIYQLAPKSLPAAEASAAVLFLIKGVAARKIQLLTL
jgi:hypothetical protein